MNRYRQPPRTLRIPHSAIRNRKASVYVAVVGVAMIVSLIGMCALQLSRMQLKAASHRQHHNEARFIAQSGVEFALGRIDLDPNWRNNYTSGQVEPKPPSQPITLGGGQMTFKFVDSTDDDLSDSVDDPVEIYGIGRVGNSTFVYRATASNAGGTFSLHQGSWQQVKN